ncbi:DUF386 family protein [Candidatus Woesearchaeota archaeon]|nr:DUF386 family protein [Candidatus Woesearchaeota archaeon]
MIYGKLDTDHKEIENLAKIKKAIDYLKETDLSALELKKKYPIEDGIFIFTDEYLTSSKEEKNPESHKKYIDVQYIIEGEESIGVSFKGYHSSGYDPEKDVTFYKDVEDEKYFTLNKGKFTVFFPEDIHRPGCNVKEKNKVKKAVVKITVN